MSVVQPKPKPTLIQAGINRAGEWSADFWELTAVVAVAISIVLTAWLKLGVFFAAVLVLLLLLLPLLFDALIGRWLLLRGTARHQRHDFLRGWPALCDLLGWSELLKTHAVGKDGARMAQPAKIPDLLEFGRTDVGWWLLIKPLASQKREKWSVMADELAREKGFPHQQWNEPKAGLLRIELIGSDLLDLVEFDPQAHTSDSWDLVPLAIDPAGRRITWKLSDVPHMLVAGSTNGGKGSLLKLAMRHALETGWWVIGANPKGSGEFGWARRLGVPIVRAMDDIEKAVVWITDEMVRRQRIVESQDAADWTELPPDQQWPPILLVFDEASSAMMINKADKKMAATQQHVAGDVTVFSMQARAVGIHLMVVAQRSDAQNLGPSGGLLRSNLDARAAVCNLDADGMRMMFGSSLDPDIPRHLNGTKGRALFRSLDATGYDVYPGQVIYLTTDGLIQQPPTVRIPQLGEESQPLYFANPKAQLDETAA